MKQLIPAALSALALALVAVSANAQVVNGNFNGLAGWTTGGDAASIGGSQLMLTTATTEYQDDFDAGLAAGARNVSGNDPLNAGYSLTGTDVILEDFVGVPLGALDPSPATGVVAFEGSAASQTFTAAAGSQLSFKWDLSTLDQRDPTAADYAFVVIDGQITKLADAFTASPANASADYSATTGWMNYATTFASGGAHTVSFGVVDVNDGIDTSALSVTGVNVSAVPETSSLALMAAGLGMLALQRRRRQR
jgi:hypothetical protein